MHLPRLLADGNTAQKIAERARSLGQPNQPTLSTDVENLLAEPRTDGQQGTKRIDFVAV